MIEVTDMDAIAPGNPFLSDSYRMGQYLGENVCVMFERHTDQSQPYVVLVNTETGERIRVRFTNERTLG